MTKEEAFKQWRYNNPITYASRPQLHEAWNAACDWQKKQIDLYLDEVRFELPEDIRRKLFYND